MRLAEKEPDVSQGALPILWAGIRVGDGCEPRVRKKTMSVIQLRRFSPGIQDELGVAKKSDLAISQLGPNHRVPDLNRSSAVGEGRVCDQTAFGDARGVVGLELDSGKTVGPFRQGGNTAISGGGVGDRHNGGGMEISVGGKVFGLDFKPESAVAWGQLHDLDSEQTREPFDPVRLKPGAKIVWVARKVRHSDEAVGQ